MDIAQLGWETAVQMDKGTVDMNDEETAHMDEMAGHMDKDAAFMACLKERTSFTAGTFGESKACCLLDLNKLKTLKIVFKTYPVELNYCSLQQ